MDGEVYIVDNGDIYCGQPRYILWIHLIYIVDYLIYVVDYIVRICCGLLLIYMLWIFHNICTCTVILKKNRLNTK